jgi:hypothetical protein
MNSPDDYMLPCLNKQLFGFDCLGCGIQRSINFLFHGEFYGAFQMYPAIYTLILLIAVLIFNSVKNFKYANKIILTLVIINLIIIVGNFLFKLYNQI